MIAVVRTNGMLRLATKGMRMVTMAIGWTMVILIFASVCAALYTYARYVVWPLRWWITWFVVIVLSFVLIGGLIDRLNRAVRPMASWKDRPDKDYGDDRDDVN